MPQTSYLLTNAARSVQEIFNDLITDKGDLLTLFTVGPVPINKKHEWFNRQLTPSTYAITGFATDGDGVGLKFTSTANLTAGDILIFKKATGANVTERVSIDSVNANGTDIVVTRDFAGSTGVTLVIGDVATAIKAATEGKLKSAMTESTSTEPTADFNYTQIFDRLVSVSRTALDTYEYGQDALTGNDAMKMADQMAQQMNDLMWELRNTLIMGLKYAGDASTARMMGGLDQFLTTGGNVNTTGGAITLDIINDTMQMIRDDGGELPSVILMNSAQKRNFANLNTSGTNPLTTVPLAEITAGTMVDAIRNDVAGISQIIIDDLMPKDEIYFLNPDYLELNYMKDFTVEPATAPGDDAVSEIIRGEVTASIKNIKAMGKATGLTI